MSHVPLAAGRAASRAGIGLRAVHHAEILASAPRVGWFEAHSENFFTRGGPQRSILAWVRERYPLSLHGVGLSLGSTDPIDRAHLAQLQRLVREFDPMLVSEHLSWASVGGRFMNDLLPLPYTDEALRHVAARVRAVQETIGHRLLIENVSSYLQFTCSEMQEWEFLAALVRESGCALLLDLNNVYVNAMNHAFDPHVFLDNLPREAIHEIHLAGHSVHRVGGCEVRIDTHACAVCDDVWSLYRAALVRFGDVPALIEWDSDIPPLQLLVAEADKANRVIEASRVAAA